MGLQVLLVGRLRPELGVSGTHEGIAVADLRRPDAVQDAVARLSGRDGSLLVVCSTDDVAEVRDQLNLLSVALPSVTLLLEPISGPPLAVAVVAALVNDPDGTRDPAAQLAMLDRLRERIWSAVWLPTVTKLRHPQPSVGQHARSWFGGSGFLAVHSSRPRVLTCRGTTIPALEDLPRDGVLMLADSGAPGWVVPALASATGAAERVDCTTWRDPRDAFGTTSCVELLAVPRDVDDAVLQEQLTSESRECPACGNRHGREVCPYCRMTMPAVEDPPDPDGPDSPDGPRPTTSLDDLQGADA